MATLLLSAAGAAAGAAIGGSAFGLSSMVIGRAIGATAGRLLDQRLLGSGSAVVETGRLERLHLTSAREGTAMARVWGRMRIGGQVIWTTRFRETVTESGGGKGMSASGPRERRFSYSISLAVALCEGEISSVGRVWADGTQIDPAELGMRVYPGDEMQLPDPKIAAVEGGDAPAYRGTAYVVFEDLDLGPFGNRVPQFSFEVLRRAAPEGGASDAASLVRAVAMIPGSGEYALASTPVFLSEGPGVMRAANTSGPGARTDFVRSLQALGEELPRCGAVALVVTWFGDDLRCGSCTVAPRVEQTETDGQGMAWTVSGLGRAAARQASILEGRPAYGGTPADASVIEAIQALRDAGQKVVLYPFMMMDIPAENTLPDPWTGAPSQPAHPWRGRITLSAAPGQSGSPDGTPAAASEVAAFFGDAAATDFSSQAGQITYSGPDEWSYRRCLFHYAHLAKAAGGVEAICIGSELRGLTQIRDGVGFPAVMQLRDIAAGMREILGPHTKIGYAADWTEYFGYHPADGSGDVYFNLDPLWADDNIDFVGIDNYLPLSDWRDGEEHADAAAGSIHDLAYLRGNVVGGEYHDWYYPDAEDRRLQRRVAITDGAHGEDWIFRPKDIRGWWENPHHERIGGVRAPVPTAWIPRSKPIWFTELGCPAVDKGTNQPNVFFDPKSSESALPHYSDGRRDDLIQLQYLRAVLGYWADEANNPISEVYGGPMIDLGHAHVWAWDARPWPDFPVRRDLWSDGGNHARGHWINGRAGIQLLGDVIGEVCGAAGLAAVEADEAAGVVRGYLVAETGSARSALQPLMLAFGIDAAMQEGRLVFRSRPARRSHRIAEADIVERREGLVERIRAPESELPARVRLGYVAETGAYEPRLREAGLAAEGAVSQAELPLVLTDGEAVAVAHRWLAEVRIARDTLRLALPGSRVEIAAGDHIEIEEAGACGVYRVDRIEDAEARLIEATRVEPHVYRPGPEAQAIEEPEAGPGFAAPVPVYPLFLDLPLVRGDEVAHAPHVAVAATPWPGNVAVYATPSSTLDGFALNRLVEAPSIIGVTESPLPAAAIGRWDRGPGFTVRIWGGSLSSAGALDVLNGANLIAVGSGDPGEWELLQFRDALLVGTGRYILSGLLRGQAGSDAEMAPLLPPGSPVVLLDRRPVQIDLPPAARGLLRHFRIGPARRPVDDPVHVGISLAFEGRGLRPLAPAHLRVRDEGGDLRFGWIRRGRVDADGWNAVEIPLGEAREAYLLRLRKDGQIVRTVETAAPFWVYGATLRAADGLLPPFDVEVAQLSDSFGPGPFARISIHE